MFSREHTLPSNSLSETNGTLLDRVQSWKFQSLSEKTKEFGVFLRSISTGNLFDTLSQLETLYTEGHLSITDFCMVVRMASCMPFAIQILRSRPEHPILSAAVQVFRTHWYKGATLEILLTECRREEGLVEIIASLPVNVAVKIIRIIGARGQLDKDSHADVKLRTQMVDFIICAAIPFLNPESDPHCPIRSMALVLLRYMIPVASESILCALIPRVERHIPPQTWNLLAMRHPILMSQLIFLQLGKGDGEPWANDGILKSPQHLLPAILALDHTKKAGGNFLQKCLAEYASYIQARKEASHGDIFGFGLHPDRLSTLASKGLTARILKEGRKEKRAMQCSLEVLGILSILHDAEGKHAWEWKHISPVLDCALARFARHREEWASPRDPQTFPLETERPTATMVLQGIFKRFKVSESLLELPTPFLLSLRECPAEAQSAFWAIAYFSRFSMEITHPNITLPCLSPLLVYVLGRTRGEEVFRRGIEAHGSKFLSLFNFPESNLYLGLLSSSFNTTRPSEIGEEYSIDAQLAVLRAAWLCSDVKRWDDIQAPLFKNHLEEVQHDVSKFKILASRARTGQERLAFLKVVFGIIFPTYQLNLLDDALSWAGKRFVRDPEAGIGLWNWLLRGGSTWNVRNKKTLLTVVSSPLVKKPHKDEQLNSYVDNLRKYFIGAGTILRTLRDFLDSLNNQQGNAMHKETVWREYGSLLEGVILERTALLSKFPDALIERTDLCAAVYEDLSPLILSHGEMGRQEPHPVPASIGNAELFVPRRLWNTVIPWIDDLGASLENLHRAVLESEGANHLPYLQQTFWPVRASLTNDLNRKILYLGEADFGISSTHYYRHIESWLFTARSSLLQVSDGTRGFDRRNHRRLSQYVEDYLTFSRSQDEVSRKIERLLSHYGPVLPSDASSDTEAVASWGDHSLIILDIPRVREQLKRSPHLSINLLDRLLPQYPTSEKPTQIVRYNPLEHMPETPRLAQTSVLGHAVGARTDSDRPSIFQTLIQEITSPKNTFITPHHMERLAFLVVSHISTFYQLPALQDLEGHGPISDALRYFRLTTTQAFDSGRYDPSVERLLERTLPFLASSEVKQLVAAITALPLKERTCESTLALLDVLSRHYEPDIAADISFHVLADPEFSSWHRHTKIRSLLRACRPTNALSIMKRFLDLLSVNKREQVTLQVQAEKEDDSREMRSNVEGKKAVLKITTIKMFLELLGKGIQDGVFSEDIYDLAIQIMEISSHPSVTEVVINFFVQIICMQDITSNSTTSTRTEGIWGHLRSFVHKGARPAENVEVTEAAWNAALCGDAPMPIVETPHSITSALLEVKLEQFSAHTRELWIQDVLVPLLCGHVSNRTKWLKVALTREGGSDEDISHIHGSFDEKFDVVVCLGQILYRSQQIPRRCIEALFPILEQRLRVPLSRSPFEILLKLTQEKYRTDKTAQAYMKNVRLLTAHALGNDTTSFSSTLSNVVYGIKLPAAQPEVIAALTEIVQRTGESLLAPENMSVKYDPKKPAHAFSCFLGMLPTLSPSKTDFQWYSQIRPILESFLIRAEILEKEQSKALYNSGACYWSVIISLKVLLLPLPGIPPYKDAADRVDRYAQALTDLAEDILRYPRHHRLMADSFLTRVTSNAYCNFVEVLPICRALTSPLRAKPESPELRLLCFEIAIGMISTVSAEFKDNTEEKASKEAMVSVWSNDSDGMVRWMALQSTP